MISLQLNIVCYFYNLFLKCQEYYWKFQEHSLLPEHKNISDQSSFSYRFRVQEHAVAEGHEGVAKELSGFSSQLIFIIHLSIILRQDYHSSLKESLFLEMRIIEENLQLLNLLCFLIAAFTITKLVLSRGERGVLQMQINRQLQGKRGHRRGQEEPWVNEGNITEDLMRCFQESLWVMLQTFIMGRQMD